MKLKHLLLSGAALLLVSAGLLITPIPTPEEKDCLVFTGVVEEITEGGVKDVVFKLKDVQRQYYINRGLENGLDLDALKKNLLGKEVTIKYPDYGEPLLATKAMKHISKLSYNNNTIYSELD